MNKKDKLIAIVITAIISIAILIVIFLLYKEVNSITFDLTGGESVVLEYNDDYIDTGFKAYSKNKNLKKYVTVKSNLDTSVIGSYKITYNLNIKYLKINKTLTRNIIVKDTKKPILKVEEDDVVTITKGSKYTYPKYSAIDEYDGDITSSVIVKSNLNVNKEGTYKINYEVEDSSSNKESKTITIKVIDKNPYIEVSITNQTLKYYEYGKVVLSSDVVTGLNNATPTGTYSVLYKTTNATLVGDDYVSHVDYWIAFIGRAYGIHDASWRSSFGGNIYKYDGSHGCINMPYNNVKKLYSLVEVGTPVYIYK